MSERAPPEVEGDPPFLDELLRAPQPAPPARLNEAIRALAERDLGRVRRFDRAPRMVASVSVFLVFAGLLALLNHDDGVHVVTRGAVLGVGGWAIVVLGILLAGVGRFGASTRRWQWAMAVIVPLSFLAYLTLGHTSWLPIAAFFGDAGHTDAALRCGVIGLGFGALASASVFFVWRRTEPFSPSGSGALIGLVGGLAGALSVGLVCPGREAWHLWLGHGLCVVALSLAGAALGRRLLAP